MSTIRLVLELALDIWFFGCICTYKIGSHTLVDGEGIKSPEFGMFSFYSIGIVISLFYPKVGFWWLLVVLLFWFSIQFLCHWYYTIFGASEKKLKGYNECFNHTIHIIPSSDKRLIPDLYHIVLHILILINIVLLFL